MAAECFYGFCFYGMILQNFKYYWPKCVFYLLEGILLPGVKEVISALVLQD